MGSNSIRYMATAALLALAASGCGAPPQVDPITGGLPDWAAGDTGSRAAALGEGRPRADLPPGAKILFFEDLKDGVTAAHSMAAHNPYHGITFSSDIYHLRSRNYIQPTSGKSGILNGGGKDAVWIRWPRPITFIGAYVGEPHGKNTDVWFEGYLGGKKVGTSPRITANRTFRRPAWLAARFPGKVDRVVIRRAAWRCTSGCPSRRWWVMDDIAFMEGSTVKQVRLLALRADRTRAGVRVSWLTGAETRCGSFLLLRCAGACDDGGFAPVRGLAPVACADSATGAAYDIVDPGVQEGVAASYMLREIETTGAWNDYGPLHLAAGAAAATWAPRAARSDPGRLAIDAAGCNTAAGSAAGGVSMALLLALALVRRRRSR